MKRNFKSGIAILITMIMLLGGISVVFAQSSINYGLNEGILWYKGYKGAYCHYYETDFLHFAEARVFVANQGWVIDRKTAIAGATAAADTGLQPNVTGWLKDYGMGY